MTVRTFSLLPSLMLVLTGALGCQGEPHSSSTEPLAARSKSDDATTTLSTGASILAAPGKELGLCGKANLQATNQLLAPRARFVAAFPSDFPDSYWGIQKATDAYVCITTRHSDDSTWNFPENRAIVKGPFTLFDVQIFGFRTDKAGHPIDVTGDGVVDDNDWHGLELRASVASTPADTFNGTPLTEDNTLLFAEFYEDVFRSLTADMPATLGDYDADGYPNHMGLGFRSIPDLEFSATISPKNSFRCDPAHAQFGQCFYFGSFSGTSFESYLGWGKESIDVLGNPHTATWSFANNNNNWVLFDPKTDTFNLGRGDDTWIDPSGNPVDQDKMITQSNASLLKQIQFQPTFWVRANNTHFDFTGQVQSFPN